MILYASGEGSGTITFNYDNNRTDYVRGYMAGKGLDSHKLLKSITSTFGGSSLGTYSLTHTTDDGCTLLTQIGYSVNGSTLNPLKFFYGEGDSGTRQFVVDSTHVATGFLVSSRGLVSAARGRFDYRSGKDAFVFYPYKNPYYRNFFLSDYYIENKYDADGKILIYSGLDELYSDIMPRLSNGNGFIEVLFADIDGQMNESLIRINNTASANSEILTFNVYRPNSVSGYIKDNSCSPSFTLNTSYSTYGIHSVQPKFYFQGDFTGNGRMEVLAVSADDPFGDGNHPSICYLFDIKNGEKLYEGSPLTFTKVLEIGRAHV